MFFIFLGDFVQVINLGQMLSALPLKMSCLVQNL